MQITRDTMRPSTRSPLAALMNHPNAKVFIMVALCGFGLFLGSYQMNRPLKSTMPNDTMFKDDAKVSGSLRNVPVPVPVPAPPAPVQPVVEQKVTSPGTLTGTETGRTFNAAEVPADTPGGLDTEEASDASGDQDGEMSKDSEDSKSGDASDEVPDDTGNSEPDAVVEEPEGTPDIAEGEMVEADEVVKAGEADEGDEDVEGQDVENSESEDDEENPVGVYILDFAQPSKKTTIPVDTIEWEGATRLKSLRWDDARWLVEKNRVLLGNNVTVVKAGLVPKEQLKEYVRRDTYDFGELAQTISHFQAIKKAYDAGNDYALIIAERPGLSIHSSFKESWEAYAKLAPQQWRILQWGTSNSVVATHGIHLKDPWTTWMPEHNGVFAYTISREGMEVILNEFYIRRTRKHNHERWRINEYQMLLADELLYYFSERAFTSSYPWATLQSVVDDMAAKGVESFPAPSLEAPIVEKSVLAFRAVRVDSFRVLEEEIQRIRYDTKALCSSNKFKKCEWVLNMSFRQYKYLERMQERKGELPPYVTIESIVTRSNYFQKFGPTKDYASKMGEYDLVLFTDNDMRIDGFPWATFVERKGTAVLAAPAIQNKEAVLLRNMELKRHFNGGEEFKESTVSWSRLLYEQAKGTEVPLLKSYFLVMDGDFGAWFWSQVMSSGYESQYTFTSVNYFWCGAAKALHPDRPGCMFVPVISEHEDTKQLENTKRYQFKVSAANKILSGNETFAPWKGTFNPLSDNHVKISKSCKKVMQPEEEFSIVECLKRVPAK